MAFETDEHYQASLIDDVCQFVRIPSRSGPAGGEEAAIQAVVEQRMRELDARVHTFQPADMPDFFHHPLCSGPNRQYANRPTVIGELVPPDAPALLVLAHSDTVPIFDPDQWTFDPFLGEVRDGAICGLGASDDKWGTATMLGIMRILRQRSRPLSKRLIFASTIDEESGVGNGALLLHLAGIRAQAALYLDGYSMHVLLGNLGGSSIDLRPKTPIADGTLRQHARALNTGCETLSLSRQALFDGSLFRDNARRDCSVALYQRRDDRGPYFHVAFYSLPGENRKTYCRELQAMLRDSLGQALDRYDATWREPWFEPASVPTDTPLVSCLADAVRTITNQPPVLTTISKQDAFVLTNHARIPTVSFGPQSRLTGRGAFHQPDECLDVHEAWNGFRIAANAVDNWLES